MKILFAFIFLFFSIPSFATSGWDLGKSGSLGISGAIDVVNIAQDYRIGVEIRAFPSGTVNNIQARLFLSNDCAQFAPAPQKNAADSGVIQIISGSGTYFLQSADLSANCAEVFYNYNGSGILNVIEYKKVHTSASQY